MDKHFILTVFDTAQTNKPAYITPDTMVTYAQLQQHTARLASWLDENGYSDGKILVVALNDSTEAIAVLLACFWVGAVPVLANPKVSAEGLAYLIDHSQACALVHAGDLSVATHIAQLVVTDNSSCAVLCNDVRSASNRPPELRTSPLAYDYLQYTSGTTGKPKGVMHRLEGMSANYQVYARQLLGIDVDSRLLSTAKLFFGYGLGVNLFFNLLAGATAWLDHRWPNVNSVNNAIRQYMPSHLFSVPTLLKALADQLDCAIINHPPLHVISAGSHLPPPLFNLWNERFKIRILDSLGSTEMGHVYLSSTQDSARAEGIAGCVPGYEVKILDSTGQPCDEGEMWVRGPSLFQGYLNNAELTLARLQNGWFRTGDRMKTYAGLLHYLGRTDDLFKVKGRWVQPLEVEDFCQLLVSDAEAFALVPELIEDGYILPTLVMAGEKLAARQLDIAQFLRRNLSDYFPSYYQPHRILYIDTMPRNDNGKVIRQQLVNWAENQPSLLRVSHSVAMAPVINS